MVSLWAAATTFRMGVRLPIGSRFCLLATCSQGINFMFCLLLSAHKQPTMMMCKFFLSSLLRRFESFVLFCHDIFLLCHSNLLCYFVSRSFFVMLIIGIVPYCTVPRSMLSQPSDLAEIIRFGQSVVTCPCAFVVTDVMTNLMTFYLCCIQCWLYCCTQFDKNAGRSDTITNNNNDSPATNLISHTFRDASNPGFSVSCIEDMY